MVCAKTSTSGFPQLGETRTEARAWIARAFDGDHRGDAEIKRLSFFTWNHWDCDTEEVQRKELQNIFDDMHYIFRRDSPGDYLEHRRIFALDEESLMTRKTFERILRGDYNLPGMHFGSDMSSFEKRNVVSGLSATEGTFGAMNLSKWSVAALIKVLQSELYEGRPHGSPLKRLNG